MRNPRSIISLAQPLVLVVMVLVPFMSGGKDSEILRPLIFLYMLVLLILFLSTLPMGIPLMSVAQEGRNMALLRSAPISMSDVLRGKFWATWIPMVLLWALVFLFVTLWLQFPLWQAGLLVGVAVWGLAGTSLATIAISGLKADFSSEELKQRISMVTSYSMLGLNLFFALSTIATSVWIMVRLFPNSLVVLAIQALAGYGAAGWIFSDQLWVSLGLVGSQLVFWVGVKLLWDAAIRHLDGWEES